MNKELFSDKNPETTVKGLGYQNKKKAEFTVKNMLNRDITYQFQVINTMYNRGLETIKRTKDNEKIKDLKEANIIFKKWLKDYKDNNRGEEMYNYLPLEVVNKMEVLAEYYNISRIIQHEYDHLRGVLFIDKLSQLKRQMIKGRLNKISKGKIETDYLMKFYKVR